MARKVYVDVLAVWKKEGGIVPRAVKWEDGTRYQVDRVIEVRPRSRQAAADCATRCAFAGRKAIFSSKKTAGSSRRSTES